MEFLFKILEGFWNALKIIISSKEMLFLLTLAIILKLLYPTLRGLMGEFWVKLELNKLPRKDYIILNNIMLEDNNGTHQIDHIVISKFGIFVIEMKNYYGMIVGNEYNSNWMQCLGKNKYNFKNPIHQNYGHVKALENSLNLESSKFISIVCFSNQVKLKLILKNKNAVVQIDNLIKLIKNFTDIKLDLDIVKLSNEISSLNITNNRKRKKHIKNIKEKRKQEQEKTDNMICPKCGNNLIIKNGKYGKFIGCSDYPKCKYIKKAD